MGICGYLELVGIVDYVVVVAYHCHQQIMHLEVPPCAWDEVIFYEYVILVLLE